MDFASKANKILEIYQKFCKELEKSGANPEKTYNRFLEKLEIGRKKFFPTVEEKQRQMTDDNLRGVFA